MKRLALKIIEKSHEMIFDPLFAGIFRVSCENFTRKRKMGFIEVFALCLNFMRKSMQIEIDKYMELLDPEIEKPVTKQAFSKARQKISPDAFKALFEMTSETSFEEDAFGRYKGWRVFGIDGTGLQLPKSSDVLKYFKQAQECFCPLARSSILCDVITGITVHACIGTNKKGERKLAMEHLEYFENFKKKKDLIIFDRGYPSKQLIEHLSVNNFKYLMRLPKGFNAEIDSCNKQDFFVTISGCKVRVVNVILSTGEVEMLITNLSRTFFKTEEFQELYRLRRGVETKYNTLKNKLDIENFSGRTAITVLQDFYATLYLSNIVAAIKTESDEIICESNADKSLKYEYLTNENILIGKLKDKFILILMNPNEQDRALLFDKFMAQISQHRTPVRPNRYFERIPKNSSRGRCRVKKTL